MKRKLYDAQTIDGTLYRNLTMADVVKLAKESKLTTKDFLCNSGTKKWIPCDKVKGIEFQQKQIEKYSSFIFNRFTIFIFSFVFVPLTVIGISDLSGSYFYSETQKWISSFVSGLLPFIILSYVYSVRKTIFEMERNKKRISSLKPVPGEISSEISTEKTIKDLNNWFKIGWICAAAGIPLTLIIIGIFGVIAYVIFACLIIHKLWKIIPPDERETTPGKAVGYLFIPFYHFYWWYVSFLGLAKCLNAQTTKNQIKGNQVNEKFALVICILVPVGYIPYLGLLTGIVQVVFLILTLQQMKNAGIALIQKQIASA